MCIAILRLAKARHVTDEELDNCKDNNWDGFGYSFVAYDAEKEENFVVVKKYLDYKLFLKSLREDEAVHLHTPFMIHFRATSAGANSLDNCHPFQVNRYQAFCHNGTMFRVGLTEQRSDTNIFNEETLKALPDNWLDNEGIKTLVDNYISPGKVIVLNSDFSFEIFGEKKGHWFQQIWWSNSDYKFCRRYPSHNYTGPTQTGHGKVVRTTTYFTGSQQYRKTMYEDGFSSTTPITLGFHTTPTQEEQKKKNEAQFQAWDNLFSKEEEGEALGGIKGLINYDESDQGNKKESTTHFNCGFCGMGFEVKERTVAFAGGFQHDLCPDCYEDYEGLNALEGVS